MIKQLCAQRKRVFRPLPLQKWHQSNQNGNAGPGSPPPANSTTSPGPRAGPPLRREWKLPLPDGGARPGAGGPRHRQEGVSAFVPRLPSSSAAQTRRRPAALPPSFQQARAPPSLAHAPSHHFLTLKTRHERPASEFSFARVTGSRSNLFHFSPLGQKIPRGRGCPMGRPGLGWERGGRPGRGRAGAGPELSKFGAGGCGRHSEGSAIDGRGRGAGAGGGGARGGRERGGSGGRGATAPVPASAVPPARHWLRRSKFSAPGCAGKGRACKCGEGARRGRGSGGGAGARGGGARPAGLRRRHLFVVLKPRALSSAQLSHNGQLFLPGGGREGGGRPRPRREGASQVSPTTPNAQSPKLEQNWGVPGAPFFCSPGAGVRFQE